MIQRQRSKKARRNWQRLVSEQERSGQSVAVFCRERELARSHFCWWKKRLGVGSGELAMILDGIDVSRLERVPRYEPHVLPCNSV